MSTVFEDLVAQLPCTPDKVTRLAVSYLEITRVYSIDVYQRSRPGSYWFAARIGRFAQSIDAYNFKDLLWDYCLTTKKLIE